MTRVLIVDDDPVQLRLTAEIARKAGFTPLTATGGDTALALLRADPAIGAIILDLVMPDRDGMAVMEAMAREAIAVPVIVQTAHSSLETIVSATRQGAVDFFVKPVAPERLIVSLHNAIKLGQLETIIRSERARHAGTPSAVDILTRSPAMHRALALIRKAARSAIPVIVEGEAGTGKELVARVIHAASDRASKPFVAVNCAAVPLHRLDALLFGAGDQPGKLALAFGGTMFLDEIGELPPASQAKLLRVIETGKLEPLAGTRPERANVRIIAATRRRLLGLAQSGEFRQDLYFRLNVFPITLPPLRERIEDIEPLAAHFATRTAVELNKRVAGLTPAALELLGSYDWPGNIGQLENALFRAVVLSEGGALDLADFPQIVAYCRGHGEALRLTAAQLADSAPVHIDTARPAHRQTSFGEAAPDRFVADNGEITPLEIVERNLIVFALARYGGQMSKVARALKIGRSTLYRKLREYGLDAPVESNAA